MLLGLERQLDALGIAILRPRTTGDWRARPSCCVATARTSGLPRLDDERSRS